MIVERRLTPSPDPMPWIASGSALVPSMTAEELDREVIAVSRDAMPLEYAIAELVSQLEVLREREEVPEVLDLRPLARRRVEVHVTRRSRAPFRLVDGDQELLTDD